MLKKAIMGLGKTVLQSTNTLDSMLRVNHAGEYGATRIYAGQMFVLGSDATLQHMANQEKEHLHTFEQLMIDKRVRPSLLQPIWYVGGFAMGALCALAGRNVAHACTAAVETVIDAHYESQIHTLKTTPVMDDHTEQDTLINTIKQFQQEECEHKEIAMHEANADLAKAYPITTNIIKTITSTAIRLAKRL